MAAERIDVLAVMDEAALSQSISGDRADMREARAAVAELLDAATQVYASENATADWPRLKAAIEACGGTP